MNYLVTGSSGFIGSHLFDRLQADGHDVTGCDLPDEDLAADDFDLSGLDGVFHLAGQPGVRTSWQEFDIYLERNLLATQRLFQAAATAEVRVVYASSSSVYGDAETYPTHEQVMPQPVSPYGVTKLACEHLAHAFRKQGLDAVGLRYFTVYGPRQRPDMAFARILKSLATGEPFQLFGDGSARRSFTYIDDVIDATILAMQHGTAPVYNIGGGYETSMDTAINVCEAVSERLLQVERRPMAAGDVKRTSANIDLAREHLGWEPTTILPDGLAAQWAHVAKLVAA